MAQPASPRGELNKRTGFLLERRNMYIVYILYSDSFNRTYTGMTSDLDKRLVQHNTGKNRSTKAFMPWRVIYKENFDTRIEARKKEKYLKSGVGREFIKTLLIQNN